MTLQKIKTPAGETLVVLPLDEYEALRDAADHAQALARVAGGEETLTADEALLLAGSRTPLAFWRHKRKLPQAVLAAAAGISQSYYSSIEGGSRKGDPEHYKKLAGALNVRMEDLVAD